MAPSVEERWQVLKKLFSAALECPTGEREAYIRAATGDDVAMAEQALRMLAIHEESNLVVDQRPAGAVDLGKIAGVALSEGSVLAGRFRIMRRLGAGGMGEVWEAVDTALGEARLALKTIRPDYAAHPAYINRFKAELQILRQVTHANVCRVFDFIPASGGDPSFFTMELVEGESLAARLKRDGPLGIEEAREVFRQVLEGLRAAHAAGIVHRDLKPANIMLSAGAEGKVRVVLMDFGIAHNSSKASAADTGLTLGDAIGTPAYMSPEQLQGLEVSPASDVYSFGVVAIESFSGEAPFGGSSPLAVVARKLATPPPTVVAGAKGLPVPWRAVVERCLAHDPQHRYATAPAVWEALGQARPPATPARRTYRLAAAVAVVVVAAFGMLALWRSEQPPEDAARLYSDGVTAMADGSFRRATALLDASIARYGNNALAHARRAQALHALDDSGQARESLLRALDLRSRTYFLTAFDRHTFDGIRATVTRDYEAAEQAFARAAAQAPDSQRVAALLDLGRAQEDRQQHAGAAKTYQAALAVDKSHPTVHLRLGLLASRAQKLDDALGAFDQAQRRYELHANSEGIAETWIRRGHAYARVSRWDRAREATEAGLRYAESNRLPAHQVRARFGLASIATNSGDAAEAERLAQAALTLARAEGQEAQAVFAMNDLTFAYLSQLKLKETETLARQSIELAQRHRQTEGGARARLLLMNALYYAGGEERRAEARRLGAEALEVYRSTGNRRNQLDVQLVLGRLANADERLDEARRIFGEAREIAKAVGDFQSVGIAEQGLSGVAVVEGRIPQAAGHLQEAVAAYRKGGRVASLAMALMEEGELRLELGDPRGTELLDEASSLAKDPRRTSSIELVRAEFAARRGDAPAARAAVAKAAKFAADDSPGWKARLAAAEARVTGGGTRAAALCRTVAELARGKLPFDVRASSLLACAQVLGSPGRFLEPELRSLAASAEVSGNHAVAWRAWSALARWDGQAREKVDRHWAALRDQWGEETSRGYAAVWGVTWNGKRDK